MVFLQNKQEEADRVKKEFAGSSQSDHIAFLNAFRVNLSLSCSSPPLSLSLLKGWESCRRSGPSEARRYCWDKFLANNTMEVSLYNISLHVSGSLKMLHDMKKQFAGLLNDIGFVHSSDPNEPTANVNSGQHHRFTSCLYSQLTGNLKLVKAVLCAGLYPNVAKIVPGKRSQIISV